MPLLPHIVRERERAAYGSSSQQVGEQGEEPCRWVTVLPSAIFMAIPSFAASASSAASLLVPQLLLPEVLT